MSAIGTLKDLRDAVQHGSRSAVHVCQAALESIAYQVADVSAALDAARKAGLRLIDETPRTGIRGTQVAFLHPKTAGGVLTELVEAH